MEYTTILSISAILSILGVAFGVFNYFKNPQTKLEKEQAVSEKESEGAAKILAQKVQWEKELTEKRFTEMGISLDTALTLAQNHTHTVDVKVDGLIASVNAMNLQLTNAITELRTTINERIPKNNNN